MKYLLALLGWWGYWVVLSAQMSAAPLELRALGTGQTTGHVADLVVSHSAAAPLVTVEEWCFIPPAAGFQSYVARIPAGITLAVGETTTIPMIGYCTDVRTPPVPAGRALPPVVEWVPIREAEEEAAIRLLPGPARPAFTTARADYLRSLPAFTPDGRDAPILELRYPGTSVAVGGRYAVADAPGPVVPYVVACVRAIETAVERRQSRGELNTPFSDDPLREREAIVQQTVWITMARLAGDTYEQEDFAEKVFAQYRRNTGTLTVPRKQRLEDGISTFWRTFLATGAAAGVFN